MDQQSSSADKAYANETQRIYQLLDAVVSLQTGKSRKEILEQMRLIVNLDEFLPEYGQLVQRFANTELIASIVTLFCSLFEVEQLNSKQLTELILHSSFEAIIRIMFRFRKYPKSLQSICSTSNSFYRIIAGIIQWFTQFLSAVQFDDQRAPYVFTIMEQMLNVIFKTLNFAQKKQLVELKFTDILMKLLQNEYLFKIASNIPIF